MIVYHSVCVCLCVRVLWTSCEDFILCISFRLDCFVHLDSFEYYLTLSIGDRAWLHKPDQQPKKTKWWQKFARRDAMILFQTHHKQHSTFEVRTYLLSFSSFSCDLQLIHLFSCDNALQMELNIHRFFSMHRFFSFLFFSHSSIDSSIRNKRHHTPNNSKNVKHAIETKTYYQTTSNNSSS